MGLYSRYSLRRHGVVSKATNFTTRNGLMALKTIYATRLTSRCHQFNRMVYFYVSHNSHNKYWLLHIHLKPVGHFSRDSVCFFYKVGTELLYIIWRHLTVRQFVQNSITANLFYASVPPRFLFRLSLNNEVLHRSCFGTLL